MKTVKVTNLILNLFVGEDNEMACEKIPLSNFQWMEQFTDGATFGNGMELSDVLKEVKEWFEEEVVKHTEDAQVVLKDCYELFVEQLTELIDEDGDNGLILLASGWGVEYDTNYGVMLKMFEEVDIEVGEEEQE